jgi:membrane protein DedA with SNARE-associated domain
METSSVVDQILYFTQDLAKTIPLDVVAFIGSLMEEIISPIPSPLVMTAVGTFASAQGHTLLYICWLAAVASFAKTIASWVYYVLANKAERLILNRFGNIIGISHSEIEEIRKHFNGTWKDDVMLCVIRALPVMPTSLVSIVCGLIGINITTYLRSTFLGYWVRSFLFLYLGYTGMATYSNLSIGLFSPESMATMVIFTSLISLFIWVLYKRRKGKTKMNQKEEMLK